MTQADRNIAQTFAKGMAVLASFDGTVESLTLAEIARATGQDRAAARRSALTLAALGYLRQEGRKFRLTPKVLALAGGFLQANRFGRLVQPVLNHHAAALGREITLAARDGLHVLLLAQSNSGDGPVSYGFTLGSRLPLLHTGLGRMLLAAGPQDEAREAIASAPLSHHTERSLADRYEVTRAIATARAEGHAIVDGEFEPGIAGFAVPVSRPGAQPLVVGASAPRAIVDGPEADALLEALHFCAAELRQNGVPGT